MVDRARLECQNHWFLYNEKMSVESVAQSVSNLAIQFGDSDEDGSAMVRMPKHKDNSGNAVLCISWSF